MTSAPSKTGRPEAVYRASWGEQVAGLFKLKDRRWRCSGKDKITYTQPDERLAVLRFREWQRRHGSDVSNLGTVQVYSTAVEIMLDIGRRTIAAGNHLKVDIATLEDGGHGYAVTDHTLSEKQWVWLRNQIIMRPKRAGLNYFGWSFVRLLM